MRITCFLASCALLAAGPAYADFVSGAFARQAAMGGAGLALVDQPTSAQYSNPAALAFSTRKFSFNFPTAGVRYEGTSFGDAKRMRREAISLDSSDIARLAITLSKQDSLLDIHGVTGITYKSYGLSAEAQGRVRTAPDAALRAWAASPGGLPPPAGSSSTITAAGVVSVPSIAIGRFVPGVRNAWLAAGARLRVQHLEGRLQRITFDGEGGSLASDIETEDRNGLALDVGFILQPAKIRGPSFALSVTNLLHPSFRTFDQRMMVGVGAAQKLRSNVTVAADALNLTNAYGDGLDLRAGAEFKPVKFFAVRGGLSSKSGVAAGVQLAGFNFAWASRLPFMMTQSLRF